MEIYISMTVSIGAFFNIIVLDWSKQNNNMVTLLLFGFTEV